MQPLLKLATAFLLLWCGEAFADSTPGNLPTAASIPAAGCIPLDQGPGTDAKLCAYSGVGWAAAFGLSPLTPASMTGYIVGLTPATGGNNTSVLLAAGASVDSTTTVLMADAAACAVDLSTAGVNGLDTGSIAASTWYAFFQISGTAGTACIGTATTPAGVPTPTLPSGYSYYRYVARAKTNPSSQIAANYILPWGQYFVDASDTYTKGAGNTLPREVTFFACGGGSSGASGGLQTSGSVISGGAGGSGAGCEPPITYSANLLPATLSVTIGAGGTAPTAPTANNSPGTAGNDGTDTYVGTSVTVGYAAAFHGCAGSGGQLAAASASGGGGVGGENLAGISACRTARVRRRGSARRAARPALPGAPAA